MSFVKCSGPRLPKGLDPHQSRTAREWAERNAPVNDDAPQDPDDDSRRHDSLLWGPLEAERRRQAQAAARRNRPTTPESQPQSKRQARQDQQNYKEQQNERVDQLPNRRPALGDSCVKSASAARRTPTAPRQPR